MKFSVLIHNRPILYLIAGFMIMGCRQMKTITLYENPSSDISTAHINNFRALNVFDENTGITWVTENTPCVMKETSIGQASSGQKSLHFVWNKQMEGGCPWLGVGFGWDNWSGKNMSQITSVAALQFDIKAGKDNFNHLPLAIGFEDYGGQEAWTDINNLVVENPVPNEDKFTTDKWTTCTLPLKAFKFYNHSIDLTNIKQLKIQFEASGEMYLDNIHFVQQEEVITKELTVYKTKNAKKLPLYESLDSNNSAKIGENLVHLTMANDSLYLFIEKMNSKSILKDSMDVYFSTNPLLPQFREKLFLTDLHIQVNPSTDHVVSNGKTREKFKNANALFSNQNRKAKIAIPYSDFSVPINFIADKSYFLEIDYHDGSLAKEKEHMKWNATDGENVSTQPSSWGRMIIKEN